MRILLVGIYDKNTISLAPQILSSYVRQFPVAAEHEIDTRDFSIFSDSVASIAESIRDYNPDLVSFSCYIWNYNLISQIVPQLGCTVVLGGPQVTGIEKEILEQNPGIDIIVTGEGERTFLDLLNHFSGQKPLADIAGITTTELQNPPQEPVDLVTVPPLFARALSGKEEVTWVSFETSRGCPTGCGYCTWGYSRKMRYYPLEHVFSELDVILKNPRIREIYLCDSSLLLNKKRGKAILDHIIRSGSDQTIRYEFSPEQLDDGIIQRMTQLPSNEFNFGIQTINPPALAHIGRPFHRGRFEASYQQFIEAFPAAQITVDLIYGLPGDDIAGYLQSMNYAMALPGVSRILTNPLIVLPGSRFFRDRDSLGIVLADDGSYLLRENFSFTASQMLDARRYSFYLNLLYLNTALKDALLRLADETGTQPAHCMIDFFETLPFELAQDYPYTIPSVKEDFERRNRIFAAVLAKFRRIIDAFKEYSGGRYDSSLASYAETFTPQANKYLSYAAEAQEQ